MLLLGRSSGLVPVGSGAPGDAGEMKILRMLCHAADELGWMFNMCLDSISNTICNIENEADR